MTNLEKYEDKIKLITYSGNGFAITESDGKVAVCGIVKCNDCKFCKSTMSCRMQREKWLQQEYKESEVDWSKVPIDTPILVRNFMDDGWEIRYFAGIIGGKIHTFDKIEVSDDYTNLLPWRYAKLFTTGG